MAQLEELPADMVFYTQITMEAADDPEFLAAMRRARIRGALVGVESVTPEGLKAVFKNFNDAGEALVTRLQSFRTQGVHVLGSFIFGLPTDRADTFDATADLAHRSGISMAQFVMLQPLPGTLDFAKWEKEAADVPAVNGIPLTRYWLIPSAVRPRIYTPHPNMEADEIRQRTQQVWDRFYSLSNVWQRSVRGSPSCCSRSCTGRCTRTRASPPTVPASRGRRNALDCWPNWRAASSWPRRCPIWRSLPHPASPNQDDSRCA
jgi:hypothetical protein